ncbi:MAG: hypothetical protein LBQ74_03775 [Prevotella sp.]|jgi:hypothetical protein|nr:hypothetical protein [Prevotella sp.]
MASDRFRQYQYALCRFFRNRGYEVNAIKKTIKIDPYDLSRKESQRLTQLKSWGYRVINPKTDFSFRPSINYSTEESFVDFADEIIEMYKNETL